MTAIANHPNQSSLHQREVTAEHSIMSIDDVGHSANLFSPIDVSQLRALIFDVDGTLYKQMPVRRRMLWRLLRTYVNQPTQGLLILRVLRAYRKAQEVLRTSHLSCGELSEVQVRLASERTGIRPEVVASCVARWMESEPLDLIACSLREGLRKFLQTAKGRGLRLGVLSDYPASTKLVAMGLVHFFDVIVSAQDPEVQRFKPHVRGLEITLRRLGIEKHQALYIGDRPEVDAVVAARGQMACVIIGRRQKIARPRSWAEVSDYHELQNIIYRQ